MPDLSLQPGNPTSYIKDNYQDLMALAEQDPEAAAQQVIQAAEGMVGKGLSMLNFRKLKMRFMRDAQRGVFGIQKAITDYVMGGIDPALKASRYNRYEDRVTAIGSLISEDPDTPPIEWTRDLEIIKQIAESHGLTLVREDAVIEALGHQYRDDEYNPEAPGPMDIEGSVCPECGGTAYPEQGQCIDCGARRPHNPSEPAGFADKRQGHGPAHDPFLDMNLDHDASNPTMPLAVKLNDRKNHPSLPAPYDV